MISGTNVPRIEGLLAFKLLDTVIDVLGPPASRARVTPPVNPNLNKTVKARQESCDRETPNMISASHLSASFLSHSRSLKLQWQPRSYASSTCGVNRNGRVMAVTRETSRFSDGPLVESVENFRWFKDNTSKDPFSQCENLQNLQGIHIQVKSACVETLTTSEVLTRLQSDKHNHMFNVAANLKHVNTHENNN